MTALHIYQCNHCGTRSEAGQFAPTGWLQDDIPGIQFDLCPKCRSDLEFWLKAGTRTPTQPDPLAHCPECGNELWNHQPWCSKPPPPTDPHA